MTTFHSKIKEYQEAGYTVFPCWGKNSNHPKAPIPEDWKNSKCNISEFTTEYVGLACNNGIEVLDFDNHLFNAKSILREFMKECSFKDKFVVNKTAGGGYHLIYLTEEIDGNRKLAAQYGSIAGRWEAVIETRGYGGQIIIPPSPIYKTLQGDLLKLNLLSVDEREWLFNRAMLFHDKKAKPIKEVTFELKENQDDILAIFNDSKIGYDYMMALLHQHGWRLFEDRKLTRPDKKCGVSATITIPHNRFFVYTSNGDPFEPDIPYSPSQVLNKLECNGDWGKTFRRIENIINIS